MDEKTSVKDTQLPAPDPPAQIKDEVPEQPKAKPRAAGIGGLTPAGAPVRKRAAAKVAQII